MNKSSIFFRFIPWRVKNFLSNQFPLLYHLTINRGISGNDESYWDKQLEKTWDSPSRNWPTKNELIATHVQADEKLVDIACGNGGILRYLKQLGYKNLNGLEISKYAIERLQNDGIQMHYGNLPDMPFPDESFDVVIASQVLEHVIRRRRFVKEIERILVHGGRGLIFVPDNCLGPISEPEHVAKYTHASLTSFLSKYFDEVAVDSIKDTNHEMSVLFALVTKT